MEAFPVPTAPNLYPDPDSALSSNESDEDSDDLHDSSQLMVDGALLGLELLPEGAEPRQRIGTSKLGISKKSWTKSEDAILTEIVRTTGAARWSAVAAYLPGRAGKQCRER